MPTPAFVRWKRRLAGETTGQGASWEVRVVPTRDRVCQVPLKRPTKARGQDLLAHQRPRRATAVRVDFCLLPYQLQLV